MTSHCAGAARRRLLAALGVCALMGLWPPPQCGRVALSAEQGSAGSQAQSADPADRFALPGSDSIMSEAHLGIVQGKATVGIPFADAGAVDGLWAPPYVSSDFRISMRVANESVATREYVWWPFKVQRRGTVQGLGLNTVTVLAPGKRAGLLTVALENPADQARHVSLAFLLRGTLDRTETWEFGAPASRTPTVPAVDGATLLLEQGDLAIALEGGPGPMRWDAAARSGTMDVSLGPKGRTAVCLAWAIGPRAAATADCRALAADAQAAVRQATEAHRRAVVDLFDRLPTLESSCEALVRFYDRSLVHLLLNRWDVPEFVLRPYYGTGSVRGGCVCSYLWNFGEVWEVLPLFDAAGAREQIRHYFKTDLTAHFAFNPVTGRAFGPWYPVNQEKIIGLVYYYVKVTGDTGFLGQVTAGKTTLEHVIANANHGDDPARPVALIDYGPSNSHLELRRGYPYNHVMPDLNGRRYQNFLWAAELAELAGKGDVARQLRQRAEGVKTALKKGLWNHQTRWFDFQDAQGRKDTRYTVQMFKLFGSKVLDAEQEAGLLERLGSEREFLSEFGLHSLSKTDPAYDPADIDNGGPGACTCFPPQIAERLYKAGKPEAAENILKRVLWWGQRMPYWGDSLVAERMDYRRDTPLQCTLDGAAVAQCILFGMFGVDPQWDNTVLVRPAPPAFAPRLALRGLRLRGMVMDVAVEDGRFRVTCGGHAAEANVGQTVRVENGRPHVAPSGGRP